jgi:citrate synthase
MSSADAWIAAGDATRLLGVNRQTLYAYVSRGFVRSQPMPGASRARRYAREDIERLRRRTEERRDPDKAAARALQWGVPVLESSLTLIDGARVYYRGHDAESLSRSRSIAEVASLVWTGRFDASLSSDPRAGSPRNPAPRMDGLPFAARAHAMLAHASARDSFAFDLRPDRVALTGWRILQLMTRAASGSGDALPALERTLADGWLVSARGVDVLRAAIILCADHELNVSSFTARCVASAGSNPYAVVIAGLAALEGTRHGGAGARVESTLEAMHRMRDLRSAVAERLRRGERMDGFGHPLYGGGDPRAASLMALLRDRYGRSAELGYVDAVADAVASTMHEKPNVDFALAAVARVLRLPPGSPLALFAIGRTIGWIGHAIEQYATGQLIRPRAKYVGVMPESS